MDINNYYKEFFFIEFFKTFWVILLNPKKFFSEISCGNYTNKSKPGTYVLLACGVATIITLWFGNFTNTRTWANIDFNSMTDNEKVVFCDKLYLDYQDISNPLNSFIEKNRPGSSQVSQKINKVIGSSDLKDISIYFQKIGETGIASKLYKSELDYQEEMPKNDFLLLAFAPIGLIIFSFIFHKIADKKKVAIWANAKSAISYLVGTVIFDASVFVGLFSFLLAQQYFSFLIGFFIVFAIPLIFLNYYLLYRIGTEIYDIGFWRTFIALNIAMQVPFYVFGTITFLFS